MATKRERKLPPEFIKKFIEVYDIKNTDDIKTAMADMLGSTLQGMLESELEDDLGYGKYDYANKKTENSRNGYSPKTLRSEFGEIDVDVPRDRNGEFEPQVIRKNQTDIKGLDGQIISMYAKGMSNRDIEDHLRELYGIDVSATLISKITDRVMPEIREWQSRPLKSLYAIMFFDAIHYPVRTDGIVRQRAVYIAIGIDMSGGRDVAGLWIGEAESSKFWLNIMNEIKNRGVRDVLIAAVDGLSGFSDAIHAVYPKTDVQRCIVHQIRNSMRYVVWKEKKSFAGDLKRVYAAPTEDLALLELDRFEEKWGRKYPSTIKSWRENWSELSTFFKYPGDIRKIIYTTNSIENFNRSLRKVTKAKAAYPSEEALLKSLYLAIADITKKWTGHRQDWCSILGQLRIFFDDRIIQSDLD
ncbi:MAG: IS256 family transposase [Saccharofermentanales bacterium]